MLFLNLEIKKKREKGDESGEKIRRWQMRCKRKREQTPRYVIQKQFLVVGSFCVCPRVTVQQPEICINYFRYFEIKMCI